MLKTDGDIPRSEQKMRKGCIRVKECKIKLNLNDACEFVQKASKCNFDIDIFYNRFVIDAKSILGVLGMDFSKELTVQYGGENKEFSNMLKRLAA